MPRQSKKPVANPVRQERLSAARHAVRLFDAEGNRVNVRIPVQDTHPKAVQAAYDALRDNNIEGGSFRIASAVQR